MAALKMKSAASQHTSGIYSDLSVDGPEIGTLVVVVDRAKNLPNRKSMGKQDPYCAARLGKEARKTETDVRGGQTPRWDQELRFIVRDSPDYYNIKVSLFNDDKKTEIIGETWISLAEKVVIPGGGKSDNWFTLNCRGKYAGEVRLELTYYDSRPKPEGWEEAKVKSEEKRASVKRRPLPSNPVGLTKEEVKPMSFGPREASSGGSVVGQRSLPSSVRELRARRTPQSGSPAPSDPASSESYAPSPLGPSRESSLQNGVPQQRHAGSDVYGQSVQQSQELPYGLPELPPMDNSRSRFARAGSEPAQHIESVRQEAPLIRPEPIRNPAPPRARSNSSQDVYHTPSYSQRPSREPSAAYQEPDLNDYSSRQPSASYHNEQYDYPSQQQQQDQYQRHEYQEDPQYNGYQQELEPSQPRRASNASQQHRVSGSYNQYELEAPPPPPAHRSHGGTPQHQSYQTYDEPQEYEMDTPAPLRIGGGRTSMSRQPNSHENSYSSQRSPGVQPSPRDGGSFSSQMSNYHQQSRDPSYDSHSNSAYQGRQGPQSSYNSSPHRWEPSLQETPSPQALVPYGRINRSAQDLSLTTSHRPYQSSQEAQRQFFTPRQGYTTLAEEVNRTSGFDSRNSPTTASMQSRHQQPSRPKSMAHLPSGRMSTAPNTPLAYQSPTVQPQSPQSPTQWPARRESIGGIQAIAGYGTDDRRESRTSERGMPMRKSVSPAPDHDRRSSIIPFGPDDYDELNPNSPGAARNGRASSQSAPGTPANKGGYSAHNGSPDKIIDFHGNAIDPSDRLPETSWAPEPEPKGPIKETVTRERTGLMGARSSPLQNSSRPPAINVVVRGSPYSNPQTPGGADSSSTAIVKSRLQKRTTMPRPQSAVVANTYSQEGYTSPPPSQPYSPNNNAYNSPNHYNQGGYTSHRSSFGGHQSTPPPVPAKVPLDPYAYDRDFEPGPLVKSATVDAYDMPAHHGHQDPLSMEISRIDIGGAGEAPKGRMRRMFGR